jgi:hypothetical protein
MEDQRDQQTAPTPQSTPYAPHLQAEPSSPQPQAAPALPYTPGIVERITRLILRRIAYGLILAGQLIRPRLGWVLLSLFLIGIVGMETMALIAPFVAAKMSDNRPPAIPTSAAVETFLQGQARYDAEMMWESFSPRFQATLIDQGTSKEKLADQMKSARDGGQKYTGFSYVGGLNLQGQQKMYFYAVDVRSAQTNQSGTISFVFTVDESGKIVDIN